MLDEFGEIVPRAVVCLYCQVGLHQECTRPSKWDGDFFACCCGARDTFEEQGDDQVEKRSVGAQPEMDGAKMKDHVSAGRKRAAMMYPIHAGMVCEWSGLLFAGGGVEPITGCNGNLIFPASSGREHAGQDPLAGNVHHGPDKSVLSNEPFNVSRICLSCHQTWHALNNRYYAGSRPEDGSPWLPSEKWQPHDSETRATPGTLEATAASRVSANPRAEDPYRRGVVPEEEWIRQSS